MKLPWRRKRSADGRRPRGPDIYYAKYVSPDFHPDPNLGAGSVADWTMANSGAREDAARYIAEHWGGVGEEQ
jgi:hypothetical protein